MPTGEVNSEGKKIYYKVLAPTEIVKANNGETTTNSIGQADIIAAFNGPMAHLYIKGANGWDGDPGSDLLMKVADFLSASLAEGDGPMFRLESSVELILIRNTLNGEYVDFYGNINNSKYVNADKRIKGMNNPDRSGDIVLIMRNGTNDSVTDRYTAGVSCKSWHGSLNSSDSYVPLIVAYPGGNKYELAPIINEDTICPEGACEGNWKVTDIILEMIKKQYPDK